MASVPWSDISIYSGPEANVYHLLINGIEVPSEYALKFVCGTVTQADIDDINAYIEERMPPSTGIARKYQYPSTRPQDWGNEKARRARGEEPKKPEDDRIPTPEEAGIILKRLEFIKFLMAKGHFDEWMGQEPPAVETIAESELPQ